MYHLSLFREFNNNNNTGTRYPTVRVLILIIIIIIIIVLVLRVLLCKKMCVWFTLLSLHFQIDQSVKNNED